MLDAGFKSGFCFGSIIALSSAATAATTVKQTPSLCAPYPRHVELLSVSGAGLDGPISVLTWLTESHCPDEQKKIVCGHDLLSS